MLFVHARKPDVLARLVGKLNEFQQKSGEIKAVREKSHRDRPYFEREKTGGGREYYLLRGGVLAFDLPPDDRQHQHALLQGDFQKRSGVGHGDFNLREDEEKRPFQDRPPGGL